MTDFVSATFIFYPCILGVYGGNWRTNVIRSPCRMSLRSSEFLSHLSDSTVRQLNAIGVSSIALNLGDGFVARNLHDLIGRCASFCQPSCDGSPQPMR